MRSLDGKYLMNGFMMRAVNKIIEWPDNLQAAFSARRSGFIARPESARETPFHESDDTMTHDDGITGDT